MTIRKFRSLLVGTALVAVSSLSLAQYPTRPVTLIIPFSPGGTNDIVGRVVAQELSKSLGKTVVPENRPGGSGAIGWNVVAKAAPDGYTLLTTDMSYAIGAGLLPNLPFNPKKDIVPISTVASVPFVMAINPQVPAKTVAEFIALAKSKPGQLNYGSAGNGTNSHLGGELFKQKTGVDIVHVPYKGASAALQDAMGGQIQVIFTALPTALPHIKSGRLKALMVTSENRLPMLADVPSAKEAGQPDMVMDFWAGIAVPAGTPQPIIQQLNKEITAAMKRPDATHTLERQGLSVVADTPEQAAKFMNSEIARWSALIKSANIKAE